MRQRLLIGPVLLVVLGAAIAHAEAAPYPATAQFTAGDSPDRWDASGGGSSAAIALDGTVHFQSATSEDHDASFGSSAVACTAGDGSTGSRVPAAAAATWSGSCNFSQPGYYAFVCTVHAGMSGEVAVAGADGTLPSRAPASPPPVAGPADGGAPADAGATPTMIAALPLQPVFEFSSTQRGFVLRGAIARAGSGATAVVNLSARRRDLSTARHRPTGSVRVRRVTRTANATGAMTIAVTLGAALRRALARLGRLSVIVRSTVRGARIAGGVASHTQRVTLLADGGRIRRAPAGARIEVRSVTVISATAVRR